MSDILASVGRLLGRELFKIGTTPVSLTTLVSIVVILIVTIWVSRSIRGVVERAMTKRGGRPGAVGLVSGVLHYAGLITGLGIALETAGIDLTALFAAGAIFAVGLGFAMQSIAQNFVAGVILLAERAIKPGDIIAIEGSVVKVIEMGIRASIVRTRDGEDMIVPNSTLIQSTVKNYTLRDEAFRVNVPIGVVYASDMKRVREVLERTANLLNARWTKSANRPQVIMTEFGSSSVNWEIGVWADEPWTWRMVRSNILETTWDALREAEIVIAFPQVDVHFDPPVLATLERLGAAA